MRKTYRVKIFNTLADLTKDTIDFGTTHLPGHDNGKEIIRSVFHDLVVMSMLTNDVHCLNYIRMFECTPYTKFRGDLLLILLFTLAIPLGTKFFNGENGTTIFMRGLYETDGTACAGAKDFTPFSILLMNMSMGSILE
jgi:hypothetical protein